MRGRGQQEGGVGYILNHKLKTQQWLLEFAHMNGTLKTKEMNTIYFLAAPASPHFFCLGGRG